MWLVGLWLIVKYKRENDGIGVIDDNGKLSMMGLVNESCRPLSVRD